MFFFFFNFDKNIMKSPVKVTQILCLNATRVVANLGDILMKYYFTI